MAASKLAQQAKDSLDKAIIGYGYGKKVTGRGKPKMYREIAGKYFLTKLTGEEILYLKIIQFMRDLWKSM